jgi:hypothetical protein
MLATLANNALKLTTRHCMRKNGSSFHSRFAAWRSVVRTLGSDEKDEAHGGSGSRDCLRRMLVYRPTRVGYSGAGGIGNDTGELTCLFLCKYRKNG